MIESLQTLVLILLQLSAGLLAFGIAGLVLMVVVDYGLLLKKEWKRNAHHN